MRFSTTMRVYGIYFLVICILMFHPLSIQAQSIDLSASTDSTNISINDLLTLSITVRGSGQGIPKPRMPALSDFTIMSQYQTESIEIINFQTSQSTIYQYILRPNKVGTLTIDAITLNYGGKVYKTKPIKIQVTKGHTARPTPSIPGAVAPPSFPGFQPPSFPTLDFPFPETEEKIFAIAKLDKETGYVNEQFILTIRFCHPSGIDIRRRLVPPTSTGFLIEELSPTNKLTTSIQGRIYEVEEIKFAIYPIHSGTFDVNKVTVAYESLDFFGPRGSVETDPLQFSVKELPEKAPPNFIHSVGTFTIESSVEPAQVPIDEPFILNITIKGKGNFSSMDLPALPKLDDFKKFDTTSSYKTTDTNPEVIGEKIFKTTFIPKKEGTLSIPSFSFSYFDPVSKNYRELATSPLSITVTAPLHRSAIASPSPMKPELNTAKTDIRYIKSNFQYRSNQELPLYKNKCFLIMEALPILIMAILTIQTRRNENMKNEPEKIKKSFAYKNFKKNIARGKEILKEKKWNELHSTLYRSITEYLEDKCTMESTGLTIQQIKEFLAEKQFPQDKLDELEGLLKACDLARFSGSPISEEESRKNLKKSLDIVNYLERRLPK